MHDGKRDVCSYVETIFSRGGKTKLVPYEDSSKKFQFVLFKEVWIEGRSNWTRAFHVLIELGENRIVLSGEGLWDVLHQAGRHLALLAAPEARMG